MTAGVRIIAFDPSISSAGFAIGEMPANGDSVPRLIEAGVITTSANLRILDRCEILRVETQKLFADARIQYAVVESPATVIAGGRDRDVVKAAQYGWAGGIISGVVMGALPLPRIRMPSATDWTRGYPGTRDDPYKTKRVRMASMVFRIGAENFGSKSAAKDVADAALLLHWAGARIASGWWETDDGRLV